MKPKCRRVSLLVLAAIAFLGWPPVSAQDPFPEREPGVASPSDMIVAVLDTGVDSNHKDLEGSVLKGWNVVDGSDDTEDKVGHGTLVAGLIAARGDGKDSPRGLAPGVKILPVKVVADSTRTAIGPTVAIGITWAVKQGAKIICIPLGSPRGTGSLEEAIDEAREKGVLVIAAAGIASGTQDFWPAAHPWAVSCTAASESILKASDGAPVRIMAVSARANLSGKTELAGDPSAMSCRPDDTYGPLEGTSAVAARAAGVAARIWTEHPTLTAAEVRRILVESGPRMGTPNFHGVYPTHLLDLEAALFCADPDLADLAVRSATLRPWPWHPGEKRLGEAEVLNCGVTPAKGVLVVDIDKAYRFDVPEIAPGETRVVAFEIPAEADLSSGRARVSLDGVAKEKNTANNALNISVSERPRERPCVMFQSAGVERLDTDPGKAVLYARLRNLETSEEFPADIRLRIGAQTWTRAVRLKPGADGRVECEWTFPDGEKAVRLEAEVEVKGQVTDKVRVGLLIEDRPVEMQYADVWDRNEIIFDMPWGIVEGRKEIPLLVFAPETGNWGMAVDGIVLKDIKVYRGQARGIWEFKPDVSWWGEGETPIFGATCGSFRVSPDKGNVVAQGGAWPQFKGIVIEDELGALLTARDLDTATPAGVVGYIDRACWHRIVRLPVVTPEPEMYFTARAVTTTYRFRAPTDWDLPVLDQDEVTIKVLRVLLRKAMPKLSEKGRYFDVHVHTAAEYSKELVDPRLAWGGPPRMLLWSAYSLGMIDSPAPGAALNQVFTTDHNCFFSDKDVPDFPPFRTGAPEDEFLTLRELLGMRTTGQEVSLFRGDTPLGGPHALLHEHDRFLPGPWFGDRSGVQWYIQFFSELESALWMTRELLKKEKVPFFLTGIKLGEFAWSAAEKDPLWGELVDYVTRATKTQQTYEKVRQSLRLASSLDEKKLHRLHSEANRIKDNVQRTSFANNNTIRNVLGWTRTTPAHMFAAHPKAGDFTWTPEEIEDACNFVAGTRTRAFTKEGEFTFSGFQVWNEPKQHMARLDSSGDIFTLNPMGRWIADRRWHWELCAGLKLFTEQSRRGLKFAFDDDPDRVTFIRKLYVSAGSDAHGDFNYATGVTASVMSHHAVEPYLKLWKNTGSGAYSSDAAFARCRTYALGGEIDDVHHGRTALTNGPLVTFALDTDLKFDSASLEWHDSWIKASLAQNDDGRIGGEGRFDGGRTALVRKACPDMVARVRVATDTDWGGDLDSLDAWWWDKEREAAFVAEGGVDVPAPSQKLKPLRKAGNRGLGLAPSETGAVMLLAQASPHGAWHPDGTICLTNPVWFTPMDIKPEVIAVEPVDGKPIIPKERFWVSYTSDISMQKRKNRIFIQQLSEQGDSTGPRIALVHKESVGWLDRKASDDRTVILKQCLASATNETPIPLGEPWYPRPGVVTFAVVLEDPEDANGNRLNPVAATIAVSVPPEFVRDPDKMDDPPAKGDPKATTPGGGPGDQGLGNTPTETSVVCVRAGEKIRLPHGATSGGTNIPAGDWTPEAIPEAGLTLLVTAGSHAVTVLVINSERKTEPSFEPYGKTWVGVASVPQSAGDGAARVLLKNHTEKTLEFPDVVLQSQNSVVFSAPDAEPGSCTVTVQKDGAESSVDLEAVALKIAWSSLDVTVGEETDLRLEMLGASDPARWRVSGTISVENAQILRTAPEGKAIVQTCVVDNLPGTSTFLLRARAQQTGKMVATARLRARKVP
ncbi:MAG: S8 family serine peptidase [Planctomycetes bacterium]|nr:S8 family serine peptidase [Planctomycetota bacterium]